MPQEYSAEEFSKWKISMMCPNDNQNCFHNIKMVNIGPGGSKYYGISNSTLTETGFRFYPASQEKAGYSGNTIFVNEKFYNKISSSKTPFIISIIFNVLFIFVIIGLGLKLTKFF